MASESALASPNAPPQRIVGDDVDSLRVSDAENTILANIALDPRGIITRILPPATPGRLKIGGGINSPRSDPCLDYAPSAAVKTQSGISRRLVVYLREIHPWSKQALVGRNEPVGRDIPRVLARCSVVERIERLAPVDRAGPSR